MSPHETVRTFCRLCEVGCGMVATVEDGRLRHLRPDRAHPVTKGFACGKGLRAGALHRDPDRVRHPLCRVGDGLVATTWGESLREIAARLQAALDRHGPRSVGIYLGNPNAFNALGSAAGMFFAAILGSDRTFSAATQDCANKYAVSDLLRRMGHTPRLVPT